MDIDQSIQNFVAKDDTRTFEGVKEIYEEQLEEVQSKFNADVNDEKIQGYAWQMAKGEITSGERMPGTTVQVLMIGNQGIRNLERFGDDQDGERPTLIGMGIAVRESGETRLMAVRLDGDDHEPSVIEDLPPSEQPDEDPAMSLDEAQSYMQPGNVIEANVNLHEPDGTSRFWNGFTTPDTEFRESDGSNFSIDVSDVNEVREFINGFMQDEANFSEISAYVENTNMSYSERLSEMYYVEATIVDYYVDDTGTARYTLQDNSVEDPGDYDLETVRGGEENAIGLTAWVNDPQMMKYAEPSLCSFYGRFSKNNNGQITMNTIGVLPILAEEEELDVVEREQNNQDTGSTRIEESSDDGGSVEEQVI